MLLVFHFGFLKLQNIPLALQDGQFWLFIVATLLVFAAGFLMNNIIDYENNAKNSIIGTTLSETNANAIYVVLNLLGVGIGFYLSNAIGKPTFGSLLIIIAVINYYTVSTLDKKSILGFFLKALLPAISIVSVGMFDIIPMLNQENTLVMLVLFRILIDYAIFTFLIHLIIEITENISSKTPSFDSDNNWFLNSKTAFILCGLVLLGCLFYIYDYLFISNLYTSILYIIITLVSPLLYMMIQLLSAKNIKEIHYLPMISKLLFFFGIVSILVISLNMKHYV
jgi:4-hydroxybenzoate polyprenyltransferase